GDLQRCGPTAHGQAVRCAVALGEGALEVLHPAAGLTPPPRLLQDPQQPLALGSAILRPRGENQFLTVVRHVVLRVGGAKGTAGVGTTRRGLLVLRSSRLFPESLAKSGLSSPWESFDPLSRRGVQETWNPFKRAGAS